jgi:hypothetical protein
MNPLAQPRIYRPGATLLPLLIWAMGLGAAGYFALLFALNNPPAPEAKWFAYLMVVFGVLFGPVAFIVAFLRYCRVFVVLDPEQGLTLSAGRRIPWSEIASSEFKEAAFKGVIRVNPLVFFFSAGCWALVYFVVFPSVALFTPWHRRVVITLADQSTLVFRDLAYAEDFTKEVTQRITRLERNIGRSGKPGANS